jgi:hypothetical protein
MAEHCGQEEAPVELVNGGGRMRDHGRRARDVTQQGDLAHSFAALAPAQEMPLRRHRPHVGSVAAIKAFMRGLVDARHRLSR